MDTFNNRLRQIILLSIIILILILLLKYFYLFLPSVLGAITLYILSREIFQYLIEKKHWRKSLTAVLFVFVFLILICLPVYFAIVLLVPKLVVFFSDPVQLMVAIKSFAQRFEDITHIQIFKPDTIQNFLQKIAVSIPALLTGTATFITNLLLMFFVYYYMLTGSRTMEKYLNGLLPMNNANRKLLNSETIKMIRANAIGIPLLAVIQGLVSLLGYLIFGVKEIGIWAFLTGLASLLPIVGTAIVWVPLVIYLFAIGQNFNAIGLLLYSVLITSNVDYVIRITLLKKIGDVHPIITIAGVIVGLGMFGFWGVVFGPLLISYFIVLMKIYRNEFHSTIG